MFTQQMEKRTIQKKFVAKLADYGNDEMIKGLSTGS
jgi:hypothetical protein